ncbi:hypothetical protein FH972_018264 [Carpinus fangiana]|uniref:MRN complex-interacting protein N-terminal domain-containing protein n=1 Tax=Carpinus fangiana TaxID=176857 RepID=A0A5N6RPH0_9ROSI|nr:hypothetical protein FH972_018264 [Carpinus fangiana]
MSTIFIAVQCCQCSTMQVRQKSKSVGKWSCVVCNQRQSLRKVFAQGFMAKDLRRFVQSFNMSRNLSDRLQTPLPHSTDEEDIADDRFQCNDRSKRRRDWSEYLDSEDHDRVKEEEIAGSDFEPKIVTELPDGMFKKARLNNCFDDGEGDSEQLYKPVFSKRNSSTKNVISRGKEPRNDQPLMAKGSSKGNDTMTQDDQEPRRKVQLPVATGRRVSKWDDYITTEDDNKDLTCASETNFGDPRGRQTHDILLDFKTITDDQKVEDDVHPDFLL